MLTAVYLDDQALLEADKIHDVRTKRLLSPEFQPGDLLSPEASPHQAFGQGGGFPENLGDIGKPVL